VALPFTGEYLVGAVLAIARAWKSDLPMVIELPRAWPDSDCGPSAAFLIPLPLLLIAWRVSGPTQKRAVLGGCIVAVLLAFFHLKFLTAFCDFGPIR